MSELTEGSRRAYELCRASLDAMDATDDIDEKLINVMVMTNALNEWTLRAQLELIQRRSKNVTLSGTNAGSGSKS